MVISCIIANNDFLLGKSSYDSINYLFKKLNECGITICNITITENHPDKILDAINHSTERIIIIGDSNSTKNNNIKKSIAKYYGVSIFENITSKTAVTNYYKSINSPVVYEDENEFYLLEGAQTIINTLGPLQGFFIKNDKKSIMFLPQCSTAVMSHMYDDSIFTILLDNYELSYDFSAIKTFGISENDIHKILADLSNNKYKINFITYPKGLDVCLIIKYNVSLDKAIVDNYIQTTYERLNKYIYATDDVSLYRRAGELLSMNRKTLAIAEGVTCANIIGKLLYENETIKNQIKECLFLPTNKGKIDFLGVSKTVLDNYSPASAEAVYETAAGLLERTEADIVLATTDKVLSPDNKTEFCYIAVGDMEGIHVYKSSFNLNNQDSIDTMSDTAIFYLIKKLRKNDLILDKTIV